MTSSAARPTERLRRRHGSRSPPSSGTTTCAWRCCSTPCTRAWAGCWCGGRRARRSRRRCARWPRCCRRCRWCPAAGSPATRPRRTRAARTARTRRPRRWACCDDRADAEPRRRERAWRCCRPPSAGHARPARLVELPVGATEDRLVGSLDLERALAAGRPGLPARAARRGAPRRALRRRGQPAARPPRRPAARRRRDGPRARRARRGVGVARGVVPAGRHDEPGGGRAAPAAARPVRAHRRGPGVARRRDARGGRAPADGVRGRPGCVRRGVRRAPRRTRRGGSRTPGSGCARWCCPTPSCAGSRRCARPSTSTACARTW